MILPVDDDCYRDLGIIENMLNNHYLNDPSYLNEFLWYNPLFSFIQSSLIKLTSQHPMMFLIQAGKYINLLSPLLFYLTCARLLSKNIALAACAAFLFFTNGNDYGSHVAGYTYILLPGIFTQFLFYLAIILIYKMLLDYKIYKFILSGSFSGIIFLFHTAPACLILLIIMYFFFNDISNNKKSKIIFIKYGCFFMSFLIIVSPFIYFIFYHYHFIIKNRNPSQWIYYLLRPENFMLLLKENINFYFLISVIGFVNLIRNSKINKLSKKIIFAWLFGSIIMLLYFNIASIINLKYNRHLPVIIPSFHFYFYLKAVEALLFGIGFIAICNWLSKKASALFKKCSFDIIFYVLLLLFVIIRLPGYSKRKEFNFLHNKVLKTQSDTLSITMYKWIKKNTDINDVFVCSESAIKFPIMATGRKLIVTTKYYSNPYVNYDQREKDNYILFNSNDKEAIGEIFSRYNVKYLLLNNSDILKYPLLKSFFPVSFYISREMSLFGK